MHLKQLDIIGFKSFVEASVTFGPGITALVGPNGTGKSNLVDAVMWALGEQSPKSLRIERMEDTIFNGAESRPPLGMAEVALTLTDLPNEQADVVISRRLFRDGHSEYAIDKRACRLRDVRDLFFDLGVGSKGCTVIEQGKLDTLLQSSAQDRRAMIEETAGTMRYKKQRIATMQKIEASQGNLLRLRDLIGELTRQQGTLKRQARAAETYQRLHGEIRTLELSILKHDYDTHSHELERIDSQLTLILEQESTRVDQLKRIETDRHAAKTREHDASDLFSRSREAATEAKVNFERALEAIERQRNLTHMCEAQLQRVSAALHELQEEGKHDTETQNLCRTSTSEVQQRLDGIETDLRLSERELTEAQTRQRDLNVEIERVRSNGKQAIAAEHAEAETISALEAREQELSLRQRRDTHDLETMNDSIALLTQRRTELAHRMSDLDDRWEQQQATVNEQASTLADLNTTLTRHHEEERASHKHVTSLESRLSALQGILAEQWSSYGEQGPNLSGTGIRGAIADILKVQPEYERAIEVALGERVRGLVVDGHVQMRRAIDSLRAQGLSMGTFVPLHPRGHIDTALAHDSGPDIVARARDVVTTTEEFHPVISYLLAHVLIVQDLDHALRLWEQTANALPNGTDVSLPTLFVTLAGEYVDSGGTIGVGAVPSNVGILQRHREVRDIEDHLTLLQQQIAATLSHRGELEDRVQKHTRRKHTYETNARETEIQLVNVTKDKEQTDQERHRLTTSHEKLKQSIETTKDALLTIAGQISHGRNTITDLAHERHTLDDLLTQYQEESPECEATVQSWLERVNEARLTQNTLLARRDALRSELTTLERAAADRDKKHTALDDDNTKTTGQLQTAQADYTRLEQSIESLNATMTTKDADVFSAQAQLDQISSLIRTQETAHATIQKELETVRQQRSELSVGRAEHTTSLEHVKTMLSETYDISLAVLHEQLEDVRIDAEQIRATLTQRRQQRDRLGPINLAAAEESQTIEERLGFLVTEEQDLLQSIASLEEIMTRLNETTDQLFQETFQTLRKSFNDLFSRLFEGGMADLVLDHTDPGLAGVDIVAQPPGKRLKQLSMLSGGEKALTVIALILASYLLRPTPLCVLDETDAPLDDENVGRFLRLLKQVAASAQFMIITHNKQTMAAADTLYGTTMADPGVTLLLSASLEAAR